MSGICGVVVRPGKCSAGLPHRVDAMSAASRHGGRAPSAWCDESNGVAMARVHRVGGTPSSPQRSPCGRYVLCLDGTLYTRGALQREFATSVGATEDDATLLLRSIAARGLQRTLTQCDGDFALAVWDRQEQVLWLARDRVGARPLYYGWCQGDLLFGMGLASLHGYPGFQAPINRDALPLLLRFGYIPAPHSIQQGIFKVAAGCVVRLTPAMRAAGAQAHGVHAGGRRYWDAREDIRTAIDERAHMPVSSDDALERLEMLLHQAVARRTPGGGGAAAFLSGGTDSSIVTAVLQSQSTLPVDTFTVGFDDPRHDEADWADQVAARLGTRHTRHILRRGEAATLVEALPDIWCEPFADASQVPTLLASMLVADRHRVVMTGDGGDELFHGHGAYQRAICNAAWNARVPRAVRSLLRRWPAADPERARLGGWPAVRSELGADSVEAHYLLRVSRWRDPARVVLHAREPSTVFTDRARWLEAGDPADRVQYLDFLMDLGNGILTKIDRAGAAHGLQTRSPLLDPAVARFAWSLPGNLTFAGGEHKWILKQLLSRHLPERLVYRPKKGFGPPVAAWLAGPLFPWANALLDEQRLHREGFFDAAKVARIWTDFCAGRRKWHTHLWPILMFQAWLERHRQAIAEA